MISFVLWSLKVKCKTSLGWSNWEQSHFPVLLPWGGWCKGLTSAIFHLQGVPFILASLQRSAAWKASSSFVCSHLFRIWPAKTLQAKSVALVGVAQHGCPLGAGAEVLLAGVSDSGCVASGSSTSLVQLQRCWVQEIGNCCWGMGRGVLTQMVGQSVLLETLTKSRRVSKFA